MTDRPDELLERLREACGDRYAVERPLGQGGTATVFLARDLRHPRQVAIKVLDPAIATMVGPDRFRREIDIAARLNHPHILSLIDSGELAFGATRVPFYVMPYIAGQTLRDRLALAGPLPLAEAIRITTQVADALGYAHREGVVHRDIKPENILLQDDHPIVADFGVSRAIDEAGERMTLTGFSPGTPHYMSPEQLAGEADVDARSDLYALGCITFEMLAGRTAFTGGSLQSMLTRRLTTDPPTLGNLGVAVPSRVDAAVAKAMARDRDDRFASVPEFAAALIDSAAEVRGPRWGRVAAMIGVPVLLVAAVVLFRRNEGGSAVALGSTARLAIQPLVNTGQDPDAAYLSDGIHEGVADRLRRLPSLSLTAPSLVGQIIARNPDLDLRELGRRLGVDAILTWTMRRLGDSLHLRAELVSSRRGEMVWGQSYDRSVADVPRLETEIARAIADTLGLARSAGTEAELERRGRVNPAAYDAYLRGYHVWIKSTPLGARYARENSDSILFYARRVLELDSTFAGGHFLMGAYYGATAIRGWRGPVPALMDSSLIALSRARALDSMMADPWVQLGVVDFYVKDDWKRAGEAFARAIALNPDLSTGHYYRGIYLAEVERRFDSALVQIRAAIAIQPEHQFLNSLGDVLMRARRYDSAVGALRQAVAIDPTPPGPHLRLVQSLEVLGRYPEAIEARRRGPDSSGAGQFAAGFQRDGAAGYLRVKAADLRRRVDSLERAPTPPRGSAADTVPPLREQRLAMLYLQLGELTKAMDWIEREYQRRPRRFQIYYAHPDFDPLRADPRFRALARREGLSR